MRLFSTPRLAFLLVFLWAGCVVPLRAADEKKPREVKWEDLAGSLKFDDPFENLEQEQLLDLGVVARVQELEKRDGGKRVTDGMREEAAEARKRLEDKKIDIAGLFAKRAEIREMRRKRAKTPVPELDGKLLVLPGFVLPLEHEGKKVKEFLLVPWVGACIHTPPPPPNQIVHVIAKEPFESKGLFEAVTVTAVMKLEDVKRELFLVDGTSAVNMAYAMKDAGIAKYEKKK